MSFRAIYGSVEGYKLEYADDDGDNKLLSFSIDEDEYERLVGLVSSPKDFPPPVSFVDPEEADAEEEGGEGEEEEDEEEDTCVGRSGRRVKVRTWRRKDVG